MKRIKRFYESFYLGQLWPSFLTEEPLTVGELFSKLGHPIPEKARLGLRWHEENFIYHIADKDRGESEAKSLRHGYWEYRFMKDINNVNWEWRPVQWNPPSMTLKYDLKKLPVLDCVEVFRNYLGLDWEKFIKV